MPTLFCLAALSLLSLKLPGISELLGLKNCASCSTATPYIPMLAASYFTFLLTATLCFRSFPTKPWRWGGLIWAIGLGISLTLLSSQVCWICIAAHLCHIVLWLVWKPKQEREEMVGMKFALAFTSSLAMMALFSTLNFTFLIYGLQLKNPLTTLIREGSSIKPFELETISSNDLSNYEGVIFHFVSPNCPYCKEQLPTLNRIAQQYAGHKYRFITISQRLTPELRELGSHLEWIEDNSLASAFGVQGFPTLVMVNGSGNVIQSTAGASSNFEETVRSLLGSEDH